MQTIFHLWELPKDREELLELFIRQRLIELDYATGGILDISLQDHAAGNRDLTPVEASHRRLRFTGAPAGAVVVRIPHATGANADIVLANAATGANSTLTIKSTGANTRNPSGVTLASGATRLVSHDRESAYDVGAAAAGGALPLDYISGLRLEWVSGTVLKVKSGAASLPSGTLLTVSADITFNFTGGSALTGLTWYHIYLVGAATAEFSTTAPALYAGTAHQKAGDATRRYLGSIKTDAGGNVYQFEHDPRTNFVRWLVNVVASPFRVLSGGTSTAEAEIDCSAVVPVTARFAQIQFSNVAANTHATFGAGAGAADDSVTPPGGTLGNFGANQWPVGIMALNATQRFSYAYPTAPTGGGAGYVDVWGFYFNR